MKTANIGELKNNLSRILSSVENGEKIKIGRRNVPIANIVPLEKKSAGIKPGQAAESVRCRSKGI